jgi:hypothetical protein
VGQAGEGKEQQPGGLQGRPCRGGTSRLPTPPHPIRAELRAASLPRCGTPPWPSDTTLDVLGSGRIVTDVVDRRTERRRCRSVGPIGPPTTSTAPARPGPTAHPRAERSQPARSTPGTVLLPRDPTTLTVKGSASSDRPAAMFATDAHQTGSDRPKPSSTAPRTRSGSLTPFRVRARPAPVSLQFA